MHAYLRHFRRPGCARALICAAAATAAMQLTGCAVMNDGANAPTSPARVVQRDLGGAERTARTAP